MVEKVGENGGNVDTTGKEMGEKREVLHITPMLERSIEHLAQHVAQMIMTFKNTQQTTVTIITEQSNGKQK